MLKLGCKKYSVVAALLATTFGAPAFADGMDFFFNLTPGGPGRLKGIAPFPKLPVTGAPAHTTIQPPSHVSDGSISGVVSDNSPPKHQALVWFEQFDDVVFTMGSSDRERYILKRPINQEAERLREWIDATNSLARKYRLIARRIRQMNPPKSVADLKEFQAEAADWYDDNAQICEELTAPRPPAKTYEELERAYQNFKMRANNLDEVSKATTELSTKLRQKYDVHQPKYTDESAKFIDSMAHQIKEK
jgi:hypothetical protein